MQRIDTPLTMSKIKSLAAGDSVLISGTMYTGRDAAHQRLNESIIKGEKLPFDIVDEIIYYVGPAPAKPGSVIGSAGPTSSYRMDDLTLPLLELGLRGMIGKGVRNQQVIQGMKKFGALYFTAIGGAAALIADSIKKCEVIAYNDLGTEAIRKLEVKDFPAIVTIDHLGNNLFDIGRRSILLSLE